MKIVFLTTAHNSLSQRAFVELVDRGHTVIVVHSSRKWLLVFFDFVFFDWECVRKKRSLLASSC